MTEEYRRPFDLEDGSEQGYPEPEPQPERAPWETPEPYEPAAGRAVPETEPEPDEPAWMRRQSSSAYAAEDVVEDVEDDEDDEELAPVAAAEPAYAVETEPEAVEEPEPEPEPVDHPEPAAQHAPAGLDVPDGYRTLEGEAHGDGLAVAVVVSRFNGEITNRLLERALGELDSSGVAKDAVTVAAVPGAFELPLAAMALAKTRRYACIVALGCIIRGETKHFDFVASEAASGLQLAALETGTPVAYGILTCETRAQAEARIDRAEEAVQSALEMADMFAKLRAAAG